MGDTSRGLYNKFYIERTDGSSALGGKHHACRYFVLDLTHDKHAVAAIVAYARSCEAQYHVLAEDLLRWAKEHGAKLNPHQEALVMRSEERDAR